MMKVAASNSLPSPFDRLAVGLRHHHSITVAL